MAEAVELALEELVLKTLDELNLFDAEEDASKARVEMVHTLEGHLESRIKISEERVANWRQYENKQRELEIHERENELKEKELKLREQELEQKDQELKQKAALEEQKISSEREDKRLGAICGVAGTIASGTFGYFVLRKVLKFEESGSVVSFAGRNVLQGLLRRR